MINIKPLSTKDGFRIEHENVFVNITADGKISVMSRGYLKDEKAFIESYLECQKALDDYLYKELKEIHK